MKKIVLLLLMINIMIMIGCDDSSMNSLNPESLQNQVEDNNSDDDILNDVLNEIAN